MWGGKRKGAGRKKGSFKGAKNNSTLDQFFATKDDESIAAEIQTHTSPDGDESKVAEIQTQISEDFTFYTEEEVNESSLNEKIGYQFVGSVDDA